MQKDKFWEYFDDDTKDYVTTIMDAEKDFYVNSGKLINEDLAKDGVVLDIGNGGIINYDISRLSKLVCADIDSNPRIVQRYKNIPNIHFIEADITNMHNIENASYDFVIVQNVIHHLAEKTYRQTKNNCIIAMSECIRVLKPGGKLIICESTVKSWFEVLEKVFYKLMMKCCDFVKFDRVYQYSRQSLHKILKLKLDQKITKEVNVGQGKYVLFLGRKVRSSMLPLTVTYFVVEKEKC